MAENQMPDNGVASQLITSFRKTNQAIVESIVTAQELNMKVAQDFFLGWLEVLKSQAESTRTLVQEMGEQTQEQQEAFQRLVHESVDIYFDFLRASLSRYPQSLQLEDKLQICLLALASRYPHHVVNINEEVLGSQSLGADGWTASDLIELLKSTAPQVLQETARLVVNTQNRGIYLLERPDEQTPAFWVYCGEWGEKIPPYRGNMTARREKQAQGRDEALASAR